ncbi:MAG: hypothetical protein ACJAWV_003180 [Flammeovirgaceae bacterium]|jgi:hypothetical protein
MTTLIIKGKVKYQEVGTGFWGIIGNDGKKWKPISLPEELQKENLEVKIEAKEVKNAVSIFMWGKTIEIMGFSTSKS